MKKYDNIEFDFTNNRIRVGRNWLEGINPSRQPVRLCQFRNCRFKDKTNYWSDNPGNLYDIANGCTCY